MLKKLVITLAVLATGATAFGQGTVNFDSRSADETVSADPLAENTRVLAPDGSRAFGTGFWAQLYAASGTGATRDQLVPVGQPVNFRGTSGASALAGWNQISGNTANGTPVNPVVVVTPVSGGPASVQLRAWQGGPGSTFETASARNESNILRLNATGAPGGAPPPDLIGLMGFQIVPEPSTIALGILGGLGTLVLLRRRKQ